MDAQKRYQRKNCKLHKNMQKKTLLSLPITRRESSKNGNHIFTHLKKDGCFLVSMGATTSIPNLFTPTTSPLPIGTFTSAGIPVGPFIKDTIYCILAVLPNTTNPTPICEAQQSSRSVSRIPPSLKKQMWPTSCSGFQFQPKDLKPSNKAFL